MINRLLAMLLLGFCTIAYAEPDFPVDADWLSEHIEDENLVVLDAQSRKWLSDSGLAERHKDLPKDKSIYVYCHDGFRMRLAYIQLKQLGGKGMRLYDGGWSRWGNALTLPVLEGDAPYSGEYEL